MNHFTKLTAVFFSCFFVVNNFSQDNSEINQTYIETAEKIVKTCLSEQIGYNALPELFANGTRLSGSEGSMRAIHWAEKKLKEFGADSVWLQPVMVPHWERGDVESAVISRSKQFAGRSLSAAMLGGSVGTPDQGITASVVEYSSLEDLKNNPRNAAGKIVFINEAFDNSLLQTFRAYGKAVQKRLYGAIEAAKAGAVACVIRSVTGNYDNTPHTGVMSYADTVKKIPSLALGLIDSDFLSKALKQDSDLELTLKSNARTLPDAQSYNVIGEIRGAEFPNEVIVVGGHFDAWDKGDGAHDDGAPCMQSMEALNIFKRLNITPKRTIRCVLFINEENGSRGAKAYAEYAATAKEKHLAAIEADRGAFVPRGFNVQTDSVSLAKMQNWLPVLNKSLIEWIRPGGSGADVGRIKNAKALFGYVPDTQRYFDFHHSANDVYEAIHPREMELGTAAMTILAYLLSEEGL